MSDGSNAYPETNPEDIAGIYESKDAIRYPIVIPANDQGDMQYALGWYFPKAGGMIMPHKHSYIHYSHLVRGSVIVTGEAEGRNNIVIVAPDVLKFDAGIVHSIKALKDDTYMTHMYPLNVMGNEE